MIDRDEDGYERRIARITGIRLGYEDHGFTAWVDLTYGSGEQGFGGYDLDSVSMCHNFITGVIKACGVTHWEKLPGRTVYALLEGGLVRGLEPLPTETGVRYVRPKPVEPRH